MTVVLKKKKKEKEKEEKKKKKEEEEKKRNSSSRRRMLSVSCDDVWFGRSRDVLQDSAACITYPTRVHFYQTARRNIP
jgi:hypothetical protein